MCINLRTKFTQNVCPLSNSQWPINIYKMKHEHCLTNYCVPFSTENFKKDILFRINNTKCKNTHSHKTNMTTIG